MLALRQQVCYWQDHQVQMNAATIHVRTDTQQFITFVLFGLDLI